MDQQAPYQKKPLPEEKQQSSGHHISNTEWGLVIGALATIDIAQIVLDLFAIGVAINRFIDIIVGGFLVLYTKLRCKNIGFGKTIMRTIATFIGEEIPVVDALPLWTLDGIYTMVMERAGEKAKRIEASVPGGTTLVRKVQSRGPKEETEKNKGTDESAKTATIRQPLQNIPEYQKEKPETTNKPPHILTTSGQSDTTEESRVKNRLKLQQDILGQSIPLVSVPIADAIDVGDGRIETPSATTQTIPSVSSETENLNQYLEKKVFNKLGISADDERTALMMETSESRKEVLRRSFDNTRDITTKLFETQTVKGVVDEKRMKDEQNKMYGEKLYPKFSEHLNTLQEHASKNGITLDPQSLGISSENFDPEQLSNKLDSFLNKFKEKITENVEENIRETMENKGEYKGFTMITDEQSKDRTQQRQWMKEYGALVQQETDSTLKDIDVDNWRSQTETDMRELRQSVRALHPDQYKIRVTKEELAESLQKELNNTKGSRFLSINISPSNLTGVLQNGFKDIFSLSEEGLKERGKHRDISDEYSNRRKKIEQGLGLSEDRKNTIYGTLASNHKNEALQGGAHSYGDIFLKMKSDTRTSYTLGDSYAGSVSSFLDGRLKSHILSIYDTDQFVEKIQIASEHAILAKTIMNLDSNTRKNVGTIAGDYLEAQMSDVSLDDIESINIPSSLRSNLDGPNGHGLMDIINQNPRWKDKVNFV